MSKVYTFHETVRGHLHVLNELPCEDSSVSFSAENGKYYIAIVADGHGSKACFRSDYGSKAATEITENILKQLAETVLESEEIEDRFYMDLFSNPRYRQMTIRRLTDTIIAEWHDRVLEDYNNNPPNKEEMGEYAAEYEGEKNITHIYGTTLLAALQLPKCLILLHQGDGRCDVFYSNGTVDQPIPWDKRCEDTATTSLCDEDVADSFRSCVINLDEKPVAACFLGCDGVEDAYRDTYEELGGSHILMGGVHTFFKDLICKLANMNQVAFESYLRDMLPDFSANGKFSKSGSGDDVSVAGIVDMDSVKSLAPGFERDVKRYSLEESLFWKEDALRGKTRKHGILRKRMDEALSAFEEAQSKLSKIEDELQQQRVQREKYALCVEQAKADLEAYQQESESATEQFDGRYSRFAAAIERFFDEISTGYSQKEAAYRKMLEQLLDFDKKIEALGADRVQLTATISELSNKYTDAKNTFEEYDAKYQEIANEKAKIKCEIDALKGTD